MLPDTLAPYNLCTWFFFHFQKYFWLLCFSSVYFLENSYDNYVGLSFLSFVWASQMFVLSLIWFSFISFNVGFISAIEILASLYPLKIYATPFSS